MPTKKATVATVRVGHLEFEGLMNHDGEFGISVTQANELLGFSTHQNYALRTVKRLLGEDVQLHRWKSELNPNAAYVLSLSQFKNLILKLVRKGNESAMDINEALLGLSLVQLYSDAFNIKFEKEERQNWLKERTEGKAARRTLTDCIQDYIEERGIVGNQAKYMYALVSDIINKGLFGKTAKQLRTERKARRNRLRDVMSAEELRRLNQVESVVMGMIDLQGYSPVEAAQKTASRAPHWFDR